MLNNWETMTFLVIFLVTIYMLRIDNYFLCLVPAKM